ncbi:MAG: hypothetical protein Q7S24_01375 [bacterium]|nr:hypothetical protein [bacterium]
MLRVDKAVRPPGLIRSAKTYSLFFGSDCLYAIAVGPASMKVGHINTSEVVGSLVGKIVSAPIENAFANAYAPKIAVGEAAIDVTKLSELAKAKHNFIITFSSITEVVVATDLVQGSYLKLVFAGEKLKFIFRDKTKTEIESLAQNFGHQVTVK